MLLETHFDHVVFEKYVSYFYFAVNGSLHLSHTQDCGLSMSVSNRSGTPQESTKKKSSASEKTRYL